MPPRSKDTATEHKITQFLSRSRKYILTAALLGQIFTVPWEKHYTLQVKEITPLKSLFPHAPSLISQVH